MVLLAANNAAIKSVSKWPSPRCRAAVHRCRGRRGARRVHGRSSGLPLCLSARRLRPWCGRWAARSPTRLILWWSRRAWPIAMWPCRESSMVSEKDLRGPGPCPCNTSICRRRWWRCPRFPGHGAAGRRGRSRSALRLPRPAPTPEDPRSVLRTLSPGRSSWFNAHRRAPPVQCGTRTGPLMSAPNWLGLPRQSHQRPVTPGTGPNPRVSHRNEHPNHFGSQQWSTLDPNG